MSTVTNAKVDLSKNSSRGLRLRDALLSQKPQMCSERALIYTEVYREHESDPIVLRRAKAFRAMLERMSIYIQEGELIVGNQASSPRSAPVYPETESRYILADGLDSFQERKYDPFVVKPEVKEALESALPQWAGRTLEDFAAPKMPEQTFRLTEMIAHKVFHSQIHFRGGIGHVAGGFERVLTRGFEGIKEEAERRLTKLDASDPDNIEKRFFYQAAVEVCEGIAAYARRYAALARERAETEENAARKSELNRIALVCDQVPARPARTFHEAVQAIWFSQLFIQLESDGLGSSPGRLDQFLFHYYKHDIESGELSREEAQELIECFWVKCEEIKRVYDAQSAQDFSGYSTELNITIGGQNADGSDATNDVSYLCLKAMAKLRMAHPNFTVRYHNRVREDFMIEACRVVRLGTGMPQFMNDEAHIPSLLNRGVSLADARGYTNIGCVEPATPGKTCGWNNAALLNLGKCLELALNDGRCLLCEEQIGPQTGDPSNFRSFDDVQMAYREQVAFFVKHMVVSLHAIDLTHREVLPTPYLSLLVDDCMQEGRDITAGGAHYNFTSPQGVGVADVADSLAAVKKLVFDEQSVSMGKLLEALKSDFADAEPLRQKLLNQVPKYGNDDDYADRLARFAGRVYCEEVEKYRNPRGGAYNPGLYPVSAHVPMGRNVGALPSGRRAMTPLADGVTPVHHADRKGPTGVINSVSKLDHMIASNGTLLNQRIDPKLLQDERGLSNLANLIRGFFETGGKHIQFNVIDSKTLRAAQANPQTYSTLVIRVAGYSAFFTELNKDIQDDIIDRTEHVHF